MRIITVTSVLNKTKRRDPWFLDEYTINLYSSCGYNCLFCYIRGSKYGENLETSLSVKENALNILEKQLASRAKKGQYGIIVMSSATEPYQRIDEQTGMTRATLELIARYRFPVHVITRSDGLIRDFDILQEIRQRAILPDDLSQTLRQGVIVSFSFSTLDDTVAAIFEPGATPPSRRLQVMQETLQQGFLCGVSLMPLLPFISDTAVHLDLMYNAFSQIGADYILPATLTLFGNERADSKTLVLNAIRQHYPHLTERYEHYFGQRCQLPVFYQQAFYQKMKEMSTRYQMPQSILDAAAKKN